ncbi:RNA-directed DNA polymerase [Pectobacterium polaris]|nr:retron St85 family RNA-directed DNA polymerase [Pectobacterium polaris]MBN3214579.1 RNA-directed DNA polymerase [Pectobacterium polaris]
MTVQIEKILCDHLDYPTYELTSIAIRAPKKYRVYYIPKRNGGLRVISQPTKQLKKIQRVLVAHLTNLLPVHSSAMAYRRGISIKHNAILHKENTFLLKMDFQNFFNKIKPDFFFSRLNSIDINLVANDAFLLKNFLFWKPGQKRSVTYILSVGAPSSPFISNFVMYEFDEAINEWCKNHGITYSRYADDITFSTNKKDLLFSVPKIVKSFLAKHTQGMTINEAKTVYSSKAHNRHVTGVTITSEGKLSVGRKRKKHLSSLLHKYSLNLLNPEEILRAKGLMSHCINIEKDFLLRMKKKYGKDIVDNFMREGNYD